METIYGVPAGLVHGDLLKEGNERYTYLHQNGREYNITIVVREHEVSAGAVYDDEGNYLEGAGRDTVAALISVIGRINLQATMKK